MDHNFADALASHARRATGTVELRRVYDLIRREEQALIDNSAELDGLYEELGELERRVHDRERAIYYNQFRIGLYRCLAEQEYEMRRRLPAVRNHDGEGVGR